jgi:mRNA interferase MazF
LRNAREQWQWLRNGTWARAWSLVKNKYIPARGDIVWLDFDPRTGHEQSGHRLVLSEQRFNGKTGLCMVCPLTSKPKGSPFEVPAPSSPDDTPNVVLSQHVRTVDWIERRAKLKDRAKATLVRDVVQRVALILGADSPND